MFENPFLLPDISLTDISVSDILNISEDDISKGNR